MHPVLKIALLVLLPLAWGLAVEFLVEHLRRRWRRKKARRQMEHNAS